MGIFVALVVTTFRGSICGGRLTVSGIEVLILGSCHQGLLQDELVERGLWLRAILVPLVPSHLNCSHATGLTVKIFFINYLMVTN